MGRNLGPLNIKDSYEGLVQISGSDQLTDGSGSLISSLDILASTATSASHAVIADSALTATSASHAVNSDTAISSSYALTASFAENVSTPTLQQVTTEGATTDQAIEIDGSATSQLTILKNGQNNVRFITSDSLNALVFNASGSQEARIDFSSIPGEIETTGDLTLDTQGGKVIATDISASGYISASEFIGDGSKLTGISTDPFPYTGSADISGSIDLVGGPLIASSTGGTSLNTDTSGIEGNILIGGFQNTISNGNALGLGHGIYNSYDSTISNTGWNGVIIGSNTCTISGNGQQNAILAGSSITISSNSSMNAVVASNGGSITGTATRSGIFGGQNNSLSANYAAVVAGESNQVSGGQRGAVVGGYNNNQSGNNGVILGGANNTNSSDQYTAIVGGSSNSITGGAVGGNSVLVGGSSNSVGHNNSVVLGGSSLTTTKDNEVVVPNLRASGSVEISGSTDILGVLSIPGFPDVSASLAEGGAAFPYTGSAEITGSLGLTGSLSQGDTNSNLGTNTAILSSGHSLISASVVDSSIISSTGSFISQASNYNNVILASELSSNVSTGAVYNSAIIASENTSFSGTGTYWNVANIATKNSFNNNSRFSAIIGGETNKLQGYYSNVIAGGSNNEMKQATNSTIGGGTANRIGTNLQTDRGFIGGGSGHLINGGDDGAILGGINADITSGHDRVVILGGSGLQSSKSDEVVVPSLSVYGDTFISSSVLGTGSLIDNLGQQAIVTGSQVQHIVNLSQAEYDALTPDANTLYVIDGAETLGDTVFSGSVVGEVNTLTITSNTASLDCSLGNMYTLTINQQTDVHLSASNIQAGQTINLNVQHDAINSGSLSFGTEFKFPGGTAPTITAAANSEDVLTFISFRDTTLLGTSLLNFS